MASQPETDALEELTQTIGREVAAAYPSSARHPVRAADARAMELASSDLEVRAALFRLVDVMPACRSLDDLAGHLVSFLGEVDDAPAPVNAAKRVASTRAGRAALGAAAAGGVRHMAHRFIIGENLAASRGVLRSLWDQGVASSVDLLGEATVTAAEADGYAGRCLDAIRELHAIVPRWPTRPTLEIDHFGLIPRANLSVKVSALTPLLRPDSPEVGRDDAAARLIPLLENAGALGTHLHVDMESLDSREATTTLVLELLARTKFHDGPSAGLVVQAYLRDSGEQLDEILQFARTVPRSSPLVVRLVKGAYFDHELVQASQHGWSAPVFESKADCDRNFEALTRGLIDARSTVRVAIASHNLRSVAHALAYNRLTGGGDHELEFQVLRGLGDELQDALAQVGLRVRTYCPVGNLVAGMAYLVRRLLENTSNDSFLHARSEGVALDELLARP